MQRKTLFMLVASLGLALSAQGADFIVNNTADVPDDNPGDGLCRPLNAIGNTCTLRAAIMEANALGGDAAHNLLVASGTYLLTRAGADEDAASTGDLDISSYISITNGTNNPPVINGNSIDRVFDILAGGRLDLTNARVTGGLANLPSTTTGGAFRVDDGGRLLLEQVQVDGNIANIGGAIYSDGQVQVEDSEFFHNAILDDNVVLEFANGAAILNRGLLSIMRSTFRDNGFMPGDDGKFLAGEYAVHQRRGFVAQPIAFVINSTFVGNTNGIFSDGVPLGITHSTIARNGSRGLRFLPDLGNPGALQLAVSTTVIAGHAKDCNDIPSNQPEYDVANNINASTDDTCGFTGFNDYPSIAYPLFPALADNGGPTPTLLPTPGTALIDPIGITCEVSTDQRGLARPIDGDQIGGALCDIGAVEYDPQADPDFPEDLFADGFEG